MNKSLADEKSKTQDRVATLRAEVATVYGVERKKSEIAEIKKAGGDPATAVAELASLSTGLPRDEPDKTIVANILPLVGEQELEARSKSWGMLVRLA